jgi:hypothetical protein
VGLPSQRVLVPDLKQSFDTPGTIYKCRDEQLPLGEKHWHSVESKDKNNLSDSIEATGLASRSLLVVATQYNRPSRKYKLSKNNKDHGLFGQAIRCGISVCRRG